MKIEGFGNKRIILYDVEGTEDLFGLMFFHKFKKYYCVADKNGRLLVPISDYPIVEVFATKDRKNYCFVKEDLKGNFESFHVSIKEEDGKFYLKKSYKGNEYTNLRMIGTIKDNYWFLESVTDGIKEVCLYDVKKAQIITPLLTEISFEQEESRVLAYVEKEIYADIDDEKVYLTSLLSFIDYDGDFVTPFYDTEIDMYYETISYNFDKSFRSFRRFIDSVTQRSVDKYNEESNHVREVLADMFTNLYPVEDVKKVPKDAKILEFRKGSKNDKK